jgi:hypothetical protein
MAMSCRGILITLSINDLTFAGCNNANTHRTELSARLQEIVMTGEPKNGSHIKFCRSTKNLDKILKT